MARLQNKDRGLFERPAGSGTWWIRYYDAEGKEHREKIGSKSLARQAYAKRKTQIREGKFFPEFLLRRKTILLRDFIQDYLKEAKVNHRAYFNDEKHAAFFTKAFGDLPIEDLTASQIEKLKAERLASVKPATVLRELVWLKHLYNVAIRDEKLEKNPVNQVKFPKPNNARLRYLTEDEQQRLQAVMAPADYQLVEIALHTGMRRGEQFDLRWENVDFRAETLTIPVSKSGLTRHVPMNERVLEIMSSYYKKRRTDWVFPSRNPDRPLDCRNFVKRVYKLALRKASISGASWHTLRHTFASMLAMAGTPLHTIQILMGHAQISMTMRYSHLAPSHLKEAINRLVKAN